VALGVATAALAVAQAWLLATAITDAFRDGGSLDALWPTLVPLAAVFGARAGIAWAQEFVARLCSAAIKSELRTKLLAAAATPVPGRAGPPSGEIVALATRGLDALDNYFARYVPQLVLAGIVPLVVVVCLSASDLLAGLTVLVTLPIIPFFMALIGSMTVRRRQRRWNALARLSSHFLDVVAGLPTLRIFGRGEAQLERLERVTDEYRRESLGTLRIAFLSAMALELAATISIALVAVGVGIELDNGTLGLHTGLFVLVLAPEAYLPLRQLGASYHASEEGLTAAARALAVIEAAAAGGDGPGVDETPAVDEGPPAPGRALPRIAAVRVHAVGVRHEGRDLDAPAAASLAIERGRVAGVAGPSGSGKSTLLETILGLRTPDEGFVELIPDDGRALALADVDREAWHRRVAWVPQHPYCFPGTLAENVRLGRPEAGDAEVEAALARVGLAGVDSTIRLGEGGTGISSGQRRRIGVARALLRGGDVLLFDEPTAGLDVESERTVLAAIRDAARNGAAVLLVAHRPAALAIADTITEISARPSSSRNADGPAGGPVDGGGEPATESTLAGATA